MFDLPVLVYRGNLRERKEKNSSEHRVHSVFGIRKKLRKRKALRERQRCNISTYVTPLKITKHSDSAQCLLTPFSITL